MRKSYTLIVTAILLCIFSGVQAKAPTDSLQCVSSSKYLNGRQVLKFVDVMPQFPGGENELLTFLAKNIKYPKSQKKLQTTVFLTFIVDTKGRVSKECIYKPLVSGGLTPLENEVLKVIRLSPQWKPGEHNGK